MSESRPGVAPPSNARLAGAALLVILMLFGVSKIISYRTQPPPPPHKIGEVVESR